MRSEIEKEKLVSAAMKAGVHPRKMQEFKCPVCKGVASVHCWDGMTLVECHACGLKAFGRAE